MRNINRLNFRDIQALNGLRVCGYAMRADMEKIISHNRVEVFLKRGYLEQCVDCRGRSVLTYTGKGKNLIQKAQPPFLNLKGQPALSGLNLMQS